MQNNNISAGRICGNPLTGLCYRVVVEASRVFDGTITKIAHKPEMIEIVVPEEAEAPFSFVFAESTGESEFLNVSKTRLDGERTRIEGKLDISVLVRFRDNQGAEFTVPSKVCVDLSVILNTPINSLNDYKICNVVRLGCDVGTFISQTVISAVICIKILTKIVVCVDLVLPCYGVAEYPETEEGDRGACNEVLRQALFAEL